MKEIVKNFESEVTELKSEVSELKAKDVQMRDKVTNLEAKIAQQDSLLFDLLQEKNERTVAAADQSAVAINGLPSSCDDLKIIGHTLNGFYFIAGSAMIESVYCDFTQLPGDASKFNLKKSFPIDLISFDDFLEKISRNGSDTPTSNRRPSIFTSSAILRFPQIELQFRSNWRW
jgi:hypothetical protein